MGSTLAYDLASGNASIVLTLEEQLSIHLTSNHYPPVPTSMVKPCIEAIDAIEEGDFGRPIKLPLGVSWRGFESAPANEIAWSHNLGAWLQEIE